MQSLHRYTIQTTIASLAANTEVHAIRIPTPSTRRARITQLELGTTGTSAVANSPFVRIRRGVTSGFSGGTAATPVPIDPAMPASLCAGALTQMTGNTPVGGDVVWGNPVPAAQALVIDPMNEEVAPIAAVSSFFDITVRAGVDALTNVTVTVDWEE